MWVVVSVPHREALADALLPCLGEPAVKHVDASGDVQQSHIRAWRTAAAFEAPWVGVVQDDVILCDDFAARVRRRLLEAERLGFSAISLYNHGHLDACLEAIDPRWSRVDLRTIGEIRRPEDEGRPIRSALPGEQCVLVRREIAGCYQSFADRHSDLYRRFPGVHDAILGLFLNAHLSGTDDLDAITTSRVYIAIPNLVDHRVDVKSTLAHPSHIRARRSSSFHPGAE
jgi:hypothetical protein